MSAPALLAASLVLIVVAAVLLVIAWIEASEALMYVSVGASGTAGLILPFAYASSRAEARRRPTSSEEEED